ncbi:hypothetical protein Tco_0851978 [Tanacetum coccineum]
MRPRRLLILLSDFDCKIRYHPREIHEAQVESLKTEKVKDENLHGMDTANSGQMKKTKAMLMMGKSILEHEVKRGNKMVKKELIIVLRGEIYFVKFIINLDEDDVEPGVIFGRSFLRMTKAIADFGAGSITIYPDIDPFLGDIKEEEKSLDDWDQLLGFNTDDIPL